MHEQRALSGQPTYTIRLCGRFNIECGVNPQCTYNTCSNGMSNRVLSIKATNSSSPSTFSTVSPTTPACSPYNETDGSYPSPAPYNEAFPKGAFKV